MKTLVLSSSFRAIVSALVDAEANFYAALKTQSMAVPPTRITVRQIQSSSLS